MAADTNVVVLVGRLTRDVELRQAGETTIQSLRLAFTNRAKRGGEWVDESNFVDVTVFGRDGLAPYLTKGTQLSIAGRLDWREWDAPDGQRRQAIQVIANDVQLLGSKPQESKPQDDLPADYAALPSAKADESIPF